MNGNTDSEMLGIVIFVVNLIGLIIVLIMLQNYKEDN